MIIISTPTVIAVTGPAVHDIGPAAAHLGRNLGDGLAVRIVPDNRHTLAPHTSPNPYAGQVVAGVGTHPAVVELECLPSAWQDPHTSLGIVYATGGRDGGGEPGDELPSDLAALDRLGLHPGHRVTVDAPGLRYRAQVPPPVEVVSEPHGLAVIARDSVLRGAGEHRTVLLEAGDGMPFLDAFHAFGLPPWSTHIGLLELWVALDVARIRQLVGGLVAALRAEHVANAARVEVARQGGGHNRDGAQLASMFIALRNIQLIIPELAGVGAARFNDTAAVSEEIVDRLATFTTVVERRAGALVGAVSTGPDGSGREQWINLLPS